MHTLSILGQGSFCLAEGLLDISVENELMREQQIRPSSQLLVLSWPTMGIKSGTCC